MSSGRINLQTAPRDELVDLIRRQAAKVKELQNASALLQERDDRLAMAAQSTSLLKQELAEAKASHAADRAAMQEQLEALSQQVVAGEETIQQLLDAQDSRGDGGGTSGRSVSGGSGGPFGTRDDVVSALDAVMVLRAERLEEELILTRANLEQALADARGSEAAGTPLDGAAKWARSDEVTSIRAELTAAHHEVAESQAALAQCEADKAAAEDRAHHLAHDLSLLEMRSLCAHVAQPSLGSTSAGPSGDLRPGTPQSHVSSTAATVAFSPEGVVPPVLQAPPMGKSSSGRARAGSSHSLSATMHGRGAGRAGADGGDPHPIVRVPVSSSVGRFDSSLSSSPASSANTDDDSSDGGVSWGAAAAVHHHTAAQEATLVGTSAAGPGGSLFGGGATMSKLRRRIAELEADVARRDKAAASRLREERALAEDLRAQIAALDAEVAALRAEVLQVTEEKASELHALQQRLDDAASAQDRERAEDAIVAGTVVVSSTPPPPSGVVEQPQSLEPEPGDQGPITQSMLERQLRHIIDLVGGFANKAEAHASDDNQDERPSSAIDEDL